MALSRMERTGVEKREIYGQAWPVEQEIGGGDG